MPSIKYTTLRMKTLIFYKVNKLYQIQPSSRLQVTTSKSDAADRDVTTMGWPQQNTTHHFLNMLLRNYERDQKLLETKINLFLKITSNKIRCPTRNVYRPCIARRYHQMLAYQIMLMTLRPKLDFLQTTQPTKLTWKPCIDIGTFMASNQPPTVLQSVART